MPVCEALPLIDAWKPGKSSARRAISSFENTRIEGYGGCRYLYDAIKDTIKGADLGTGPSDELAEIKNSSPASSADSLG